MLRVETGAAVLVVLSFLCCEIGFAQGLETLRIVSPLDQTVLAPGETVSVVVRVPTSAQIVVVAENPLQTYQVSASEYSLSIPANTRPGRYRVTASLISEPGTVSESASIRVDVERPDSPTRIQIEPALIRFQFAGSQMPLGVIGTFATGENVTLTKSSRTLYESSNARVATVDLGGLVTAVSSGEASISVRHGDHALDVRVLVPKTVSGDLDADGDVDVEDLTILTDASNRPSNGPFDARDLNADGIISTLDKDILKNLCTRENCATAGMSGSGKEMAPIQDVYASMDVPGNAAGVPITLVDPVPALLNGSQITTDVNLLATQGRIVQGVSADGATQIVLRIQAGRTGEVFDLTVLKDLSNESGSTSEDGALGVPGATAFQKTQPVTAVSTSAGIMGFAVYRAPLDFPRQNGIDVNAASRIVGVRVKSRDTSGLSTSVFFKVVRPPVVLIHGLWGAPSSFDFFTPLISDSRFAPPLARVDYDQPVPGIVSSNPSYNSFDVLRDAKASSLGFDYNAPNVLNQLSSRVASYKLSQNVAAIQADIVAHSMGGNIARTMTILPSFSNSLNFGLGSIHKLITIGTPHLGTPLASQLLQDNNKCTRDTLASRGLVSISSATLVGGFAVSGAVSDLQGDMTGSNLSTALRNIQQGGQRSPMAWIGGSMSQAQLDGLHCFLCAADYIYRTCGMDVLGGSLTASKWPTVVGSESDAVVPLNSQLSGQTANSSLVSVHAAVHSSAVADKSLSSLGFGSPHELEEPSGIPSRVIDFLNTPLTGGPQISSSATWLLPSSARAAGLGGAFYTTDLTLSNTGTSEVAVTLKFLGNNVDGRSGTEKTLLLGAGKSQTLTDVLSSVFSLSSGFGAIRIASSSQNLNILAETSTPGPSGGTFGQSVPAATSKDVIGSETLGVISGVRENVAFRTNLIVANQTELPIDVGVTMVFENGSSVPYKHYNIPPLGMTQVTKIVRELGVTTDVNGAMLALYVTTPGGAFAAYASVIDNVTNDPRTLLMKKSTLGDPVWILPSSARSGGAGGAFYTTDLTISNIGLSDTSFTLKFLGNNVDGRQGSEKSFNLGTGKTVTYQDVLGSVFGLSSGFGAIRVTSSSQALTVLGQTSTPSGGGTFGQSVPAADSSDLIRFGAPRSIVGVREDQSFRTNLILCNATQSPVDVDVSMINENGATVGSSRRYQLPPLGMTQVSRVVGDLGIGDDLRAGRLLLSTPTEGGSFAAYASVIDNVTNDPRTLLPLHGSALTGVTAPVKWGNTITLDVNNNLIYPADIRVNGFKVGTVPASQRIQQQAVTPWTFSFSFDLVRPIRLGDPLRVPLGEQMTGIFSPTNNPSGTVSFNITNIIGTQQYFAPTITNQTTVGLLMGVNMGLGTGFEQRCNCAVPANGTNVSFGYYRLLSNGNVRAYQDTSNYTPPYRFWAYGTHYNNMNVENGSGILRLLTSIPP